MIGVLSPSLLIGVISLVSPIFADFHFLIKVVNNRSSDLHKVRARCLRNKLSK